MGLFGTSDPVKKEEKLINKGKPRVKPVDQGLCRSPDHLSFTADSSLEAKSEEKHLKQALKDVEHATSEEEKGAKREHHALGVSWQRAVVIRLQV